MNFFGSCQMCLNLGPWAASDCFTLRSQVTNMNDCGRWLIAMRRRFGKHFQNVATPPYVWGVAAIAWRLRHVDNQIPVQCDSSISHVPVLSCDNDVGKSLKYSRIS